MLKKYFRQFILGSLLWGLSAEHVVAQVDGLFTQYDEVKSYYNPAYVGNSDKMNLTLASKMQWVGVSGAPTSFYVNLGSPIPMLPTGHGVGLTALSETIGMYSNTGMSLQYSYLLLRSAGELRIGAQVGLLNQKVDASDAFVPDGDSHTPPSTDPNIPSGDAEGMSFDMGLGVNYTYEGFTTGLSMSHLLAPKIHLNDRLSVKIPPILYYYAQYDHPLNEGSMTVSPSLFMRTDFVVFQPSFGVKLSFLEKYFAGISYRWGESVGVMVGAQFESFRFGYCYDIVTNRLSRVSGGSHELFFTYVAKLNLNKRPPKSTRKSVRML